MSDDPFSSVVQSQKLSHCGPTSLSSCLSMLGCTVTPRELAADAGKKYLVYFEGLDENDLKRAARANGVQGRFVCEYTEGGFRRFKSSLDAHLKSGNNAILLVWDFSHWVSVLGKLNGKYVVMDPNDDTSSFTSWTDKQLRANAWNGEGDEEKELVDPGNTGPPM